MAFSIFQVFCVDLKFYCSTYIFVFLCQGQTQIVGVSEKRGEVSPTHKSMVYHLSNLKCRNTDRQDHMYKL